MTRFFFPIEDAVELVLTALEHADQFRGKVLSREMKSARVQDILDTWIEMRGGRWEKMEGRPGDRPYECLIGEQELPYTQMVMLNGIPHYSISFNDRVANPLSAVVSSDTAQALTRSEISALINAVPPEAT